MVFFRKEKKFITEKAFSNAKDDSAELRRKELKALLAEKKGLAEQRRIDKLRREIKLEKQPRALKIAKRIVTGTARGAGEAFRKPSRPGIRKPKLSRKFRRKVITVPDAPGDFLDPMGEMSRKKKRKKDMFDPFF